MSEIKLFGYRDNHTPTPWKCEKKGGCLTILRQDEEGYYIAMLGLDAFSFADRPEILRADGDFIVRAVNAHEALLEALEKIRQVLRDGNPAITDTVWVGPGMTMLDLCDHALAKGAPE